jgi:hypothetical protein
MIRRSQPGHRRGSPIHEKSRKTSTPDHYPERSPNPEVSLSNRNPHHDTRSFSSSEDISPSAWPCNLGSNALRDCFRNDHVASDEDVQAYNPSKSWNKPSAFKPKQAIEDKMTQTPDKNTRTALSDEDVDDNEVEDILSRISQRKYRSGQQILVAIGKDRYLSPVSNSTLTTPPSIRTTQSDTSDGIKSKQSKHLKGQFTHFSRTHI